MLSPRARIKILNFFIFRFRPFWGRIFILRRFSLKMSSKSAFEHCAKDEKECKSRKDGKWDGKCPKDELGSITLRAGMDPLHEYRSQ